MHIVETTLDLDLQQEVTRTAWSALLEWESEGASNGAASQLANKVLLALHRGDDRLAHVPFAPPRGTRPVRLCALTGQRATDACDQTDDVLALHRNALPTDPRQLRPELSKVILDCLKKEPSDRIASAGKLREKLESIREKR